MTREDVKRFLKLRDTSRVKRLMELEPLERDLLFLQIIAPDGVGLRENAGPLERLAA